MATYTVSGSFTIQPADNHTNRKGA